MTAQRKARIDNILAKRQANLTIILENVHDPHNIAAVMRTCDAVGIQDIYVINTKAPRQQLWSAKASSSAANWLTVHQYTNVAACVNDVKLHFNKIYTTHLSTNAVGLYELNLTQNVALVFGNEHDGCSEEIIALADGNFIIPQVGIIKSLNISVACAVTLYEAYRQKNNAGHYNQTQLEPEYAASLIEKWGIAKAEKRATIKELRKAQHQKK